MRHPVPLLAGLLVTLAAAPAAEARTVTVETSGRSVSLKPGDRLVVDVAENPTTGYSWAITARPAFLTLTRSRYVSDPQPAGAPPVAGGGGRHAFTFRARTTGRGTLKLRYRRSFAPAASDRTFTVRVVVKR